MNVADVSSSKNMCGDIMGKYDVAVLQDGRYTGIRYNYKFNYGDYAGCNYPYMLLMDGEQKKPLDFSATCPEESPNYPIDPSPGLAACVKVRKGPLLPKGRRVMTIADVKAQSDQCRNALKQVWDIVALEDGSASGSGYNYDLNTGNHFGCDTIGSMFIMNGEQDVPPDFRLPCPEPK